MSSPKVRQNSCPACGRARKLGRTGRCPRCRWWNIQGQVRKVSKNVRGTGE